MSSHEATTETHQKESKGSNKSLKCDRRCMHQGDRICYNDELNTEIIRTIPQDADQTESSESGEDSLHSGESLFKSFNFDPQDNDPDLEKCMNFWKSILSKNMKPIKCSLLKSKQTKEPVVKKEKVQEICKKDDTKEMWLSIYKDLQRRNLDKIKLVRKKVCDPCAEYIDEEELKKQDVQEIQNLNNWKSEQPTRIHKIDIKSQVHRTFQVLQAARGSQNHEPKSSTKSKETRRQKTVTGRSENRQEKDTGRSENQQKTDVGRSESQQEKVTGRSESRQETIVKEKPRIEEIKSSSIRLAEPDLKNVQSIKQLEVCCKCGCDIDQCCCAEMEKLIGTESDDQKVDACYPCDCSQECVCEHPIPGKDICSCGCRIDECICEKSEACICGCKLWECICDKLEETECSCGCGLEECICKELFTKTCRCGHDDCSCDMVAILSTYLETLNSPSKMQVSVEGDDLKLVSTQAQTDEEKKWLLETTQKQGSYCIICGHFNCLCKSEPEN